ncbi:MAG: PH domain-containing protein [Planctomyces sp.]|nr:PH domain-containing protein [Planctomyces sp.]
MSTAVAPQPIAGVSPSQERAIEVVYPSIASLGSGRLIGSILESIPASIGGVKLSHMLFALPLAPLGLALYLVRGIFGLRYAINSRSVAILNSGGRVERKVSLSDVRDIVVDQQPGQEFYHAADVVLVGTDGSELMRMAGISRPERVRRLLIDSRDAYVQNAEALTAIGKRSS